MKEIFKSRIIRFIVGPEREQFTAHESSIAGLSAPLRVLVTGNMKESIEATVIWDDIDPALFMEEHSANGKFSQKHFRLKQFHQLKDDPSSLNVDMIPYNVKAYMMAAKLYVLADNLAYISGNDMTMDILVATMRYVYENTIQKDQLRKLLLRFLITDMQWVLSNKGMRKMLSDIPELASQMILLVPSYYWDELHWGRPSTSTQATMTS
ncbi:hypothetical protein K4K54_006843 [Colletotrichum sp. SAR 10_86]|nr:hypothetical protein K4K54_006843 [Colletotrichum sp. SAR 10_86]KAJ4998484.1 hypothetical protein K4K48_005363 [Colletotrichum sp. SAR 10_66]